MRSKRKIPIRNYFSVSLKDFLLMILILLSSTGLCFMLLELDDSVDNVPMIFILSVFLISCYTNGYLFGLSSSIISVLLVNYFFTYPYFNFNFTLTGYPLAIACMISVAVITSAMTSKIKLQSELSVEAAREKTRSNLLRAISHDLRTPLTSILGASSAIEENYDILSKEERIELLQGISEEAQWLIRMVENLLSITRFGGEDSITRIGTVPEAAEEIVSEAVVKLRKRFPDQQVSVKVPGELLMVPMDAMLIEQVLINLMENSILHSQGATRIELVALRSEKNAIFKVVDNGKGIDPQLLPRIFDGKLKPTAGENADSRRSMGIGLSVCNTIVSAHGGTLTAANAPGGGAVFRFTLPLEGEEYGH